MAELGSVRQRIVSSVFSKLNASGFEESYVAHVKIWEDGDGTGRKPRYILLSQAANGAGFIHKSKLNTNGTFSVGKTWRLEELRSVQVSNPLAFSITLSRTYRWQTENPNDQASFLASLVKLFRIVTKGVAPLQLEGLRDPDPLPTGRQAVQSDDIRSESPHSMQPLRNFRSGISSRPHTPNQSDYDASPASRSQSRAAVSSRPPSPNNSVRGGYVSSARQRSITPTQNHPVGPTSQSQISTLRPRPGRRLSNGASTASPIPSINLPSNPKPPSIAFQRSRPSRESLTSSRPSLDQPSESSNLTPSPMSYISVQNESASPSHTASPFLNSRGISPEPLSRSRQQASRGGTTVPEAPQPRRDLNARVSFFDPANQGSLDRLISGSNTLTSVDGEDESAQATMANVEEMLEGYEWATDDVIGRKTARGAADLIEARLLDELVALEKANIYSFLESDDRIGTVCKFLDEAISELDNMESSVSSYKIHLNAVGDDISYIQSQNRGLQVQTQNQRALLRELETLLQTVHVNSEALLTLTQDSLEKAAGITRIEEAATELYKALLAGRDREMAATMERLDEYRTHNAQFCKRMYDFLSIMFTAQSRMLLGDNDGVIKTKGRGRAVAVQHEDMEKYLGRYAGLMLYLKEMDEVIYGKLCAAYFSAASDMHSKQMKALLSTHLSLVKKITEEELEQSFSTTPVGGYRQATGMRRAGTIIRSPLEGRRDKGDKSAEADLRASEAFGLVLEQIAPLIYREDEFITDFLQINDAALTFADYMGLENYFKRQALRSSGLSQSTMKLVRGAMDLMFGFLPAELKSWLDTAVAKDSMEIIGVIASLERFLADAEEKGIFFLQTLLDKQHTRLKGMFDRYIAEQTKGVEQTKLTSKKRKGVAHFIKYFPVYIGRVESQLVGADGLQIRSNVDRAYEKIVQTMFDSLKQMAKMDGEGEDKGQLNYHVILIENMHYFVAEIGQLQIGAVAVFLRRAESVYDENLSSYIKIVLRRPFAKMIDYFEGVERLLKTTAPTEIASNSSYNKSALKKVVKEFTGKDIRKHVDALFKRVEKHFTEASEKTTTEESGGIAPGTVMVGVWRACEEELLRITELFSKRISQCYSESGVSLEYTAADIVAAFRRHS